MNFKILIIWTMLMLSSVSISFGQTLDEHQWKNRVIVVISDNSLLMKYQVDLLKRELSGLEERKLIVYKISSKQYLKGIDNNDDASFPSNYSQLKKTKKPLEVILIGLDGGVKLRQTKLLTTKKLFTLIDGMPMRRQELRN